MDMGYANTYFVRRTYFSKEQQRFLRQLANQKKPDYDKLYDVIDWLTRIFKATIRNDRSIHPTVMYEMDLQHILKTFPTYNVYVKLLEVYPNIVKEYLTELTDEEMLEKVSPFQNEILNIMTIME